MKKLISFALVLALIASLCGGLGAFADSGINNSIKNKTESGSYNAAAGVETYLKTLDLDDDLQLPKKSSYLSVRQVMFIDAPGGHSVYTYVEPDSGADNLSPAYHESKVSVYAVEDDWAFIVYEDEQLEKQAAWVNADNLVELAEKSKGKTVGFGKAIYDTNDTISLIDVEQKWSKLNFVDSKTKWVEFDAELEEGDEFVAMDIAYHVIGRNGVKDASGERDVYINDGEGWEYVGSFEVSRDLEPVTIHINYDEPREIKAVAVVPTDSDHEKCLVRTSVIWLYCSEK